MKCDTCLLNSGLGESFKEGRLIPFLKELKMEANLRPEEQVAVSEAQRDRAIIQVEGTACVNTGPLENIVLLSGNGDGSTGWRCGSGRRRR